jgi:isoleucyl-tRNA synthetase
VHQSDWQPKDFARSKEEKALWSALFEVREATLTELEKARQAKLIGKALEAKVVVSGSHPALALVTEAREALRELLNVSQLEIQGGGDAQINAAVTKADGVKCERCWHWETDVGAQAAHPTICARCAAAV